MVPIDEELIVYCLRILRDLKWRRRGRPDEVVGAQDLLQLGKGSADDVIKKILKHLGLWDQKARPPPKANSPPMAPEYYIDPE